MKHRPLIQPPPEFAFAPQAFNLFGQTTQDGARLAQEAQEAQEKEDARRAAVRNHPQLFQTA